MARSLPDLRNIICIRYAPDHWRWQQFSSFLGVSIDQKAIVLAGRQVFVFFDDASTAASVLCKDGREVGACIVNVRSCNVDFVRKALGEHEFKDPKIWNYPGPDPRNPHRGSTEWWCERERQSLLGSKRENEEGAAVALEEYRRAHPESKSSIQFSPQVHAGQLYHSCRIDSSEQTFSGLGWTKGEAKKVAASHLLQQKKPDRFHRVLIHRQVATAMEQLAGEIPTPTPSMDGGGSVQRSSGVFYIYEMDRHQIKHVTVPGSFSNDSTRYKAWRTEEGDYFLGAGSFGAVVKRLWRGMKVAVKIAKPCTTTEAALQAEGNMMMKAGSHEHILPLLAICTIGTPSYLVLPFMEGGSLSSYLRMEKKKAPSAREISPAVLFKYLGQIASGMQHLASRRIIHGDLAARNVLISGHPANGVRILKISDYGWAKMMDSEGLYYVQKEENDESILYISPEGYNHWRFSEMSDVWAFGVVIYETFSMGETPYHEEIEKWKEDPRYNLRMKMKKKVLAKTGKVRLSFPRLFPRTDLAPFDPILVRLMYSCFLFDPSTRLPFNSIVNTLRI